MTDDTMPLLDALLKRGGGDFMKNLAEKVLARLVPPSPQFLLHGLELRHHTVAARQLQEQEPAPQ